MNAAYSTHNDSNENMFDKIKRLFELRLELIWTQAKMGATSSLSTAAVYLIVGLCALLFLFFGSLSAAWAFGQAWNNPALGFLAVAGIYLLLAVVGIALRNSIKTVVQTSVDKSIDRLVRAGLDDMSMEEVTAAGLPGADTRLEGIESPAPVTEPHKADPQNAPRASQAAETHGDRLRDAA